MLLPLSCLSYNIQEYSNKFNGIRKELAKKKPNIFMYKAIKVLISMLVLEETDFCLNF